MEKNVPCRYLTNEGIQYLRDYLHLPSEIVPSTLKRALPRGDARPARTAAPRPGGDKPSSQAILSLTEESDLTEPTSDSPAFPRKPKPRVSG